MRQCEERCVKLMQEDKNVNKKGPEFYIYRYFKERSVKLRWTKIDGKKGNLYSLIYTKGRLFVNFLQQPHDRPQIKLFLLFEILLRISLVVLESVDFIKPLPPNEVLSTSIVGLCFKVNGSFYFTFASVLVVKTLLNMIHGFL